MNAFLRIVLILIAVILAAIVAAYLALLRADIPYATLDAKYANPQSRFMDLPGNIRLHYRDQGNPSGPVVIMVHGFAASLHAWEPWVAILGKDYRIVTLDLPGQGLTRAPATYGPSIAVYADLVDDVAKRLNLGPYVIVGNSMGGGVAWSDALRHPASVRALVLVDAAGWPQEQAMKGDAPLVFRLLNSPVGQALIKNIDMRPMAGDGLKAAYVNKALVTPALVDRYVELSRAPGHRDILLAIVGERPDGVTVDTFRHLNVPTLVMHGEADKIIPFADGEGFAATIPGARFIAYPGVGHVPMEQIPAQSAADLDAFLKSLKP